VRQQLCKLTVRRIEMITDTLWDYQTDASSLAPTISTDFQLQLQQPQEAMHAIQRDNWPTLITVSPYACHFVPSVTLSMIFPAFGSVGVRDVQVVSAHVLPVSLYHWKRPLVARNIDSSNCRTSRRHTDVAVWWDV